MTTHAILGDSREVLPGMDADSFDSCVTDPPYALTANKRGGSGMASINLASPAGRSRIATGNGGGFMGQKWDTGETAFDPAFWREVLRVLKPGAHLLACGGTRTFHRLACAIEDAGFEIRDAVMWHYGSGFPKSHSVSAAIDRAAGAEREVVGQRVYAGGHVQNSSKDKLAPPIGTFIRVQDDRIITAPATEAARQWEGWGTALKPATEIICLARKPLSEPTIAANVLRWSVGALNIDACRVATTDTGSRDGGRRPTTHDGYQRPNATMFQDKTEWELSTKGRWPANLIHDGSEEVLAGFPETASGTLTPDMDIKPSSGWSGGSQTDRVKNSFAANSGSAARFFYHAKANKTDRDDSKHPTVKPVDLMAYLIRLVTRPGGLVLDPFAGSGTTGEAAIREGCRAVLIEREPQYYADIERRLERARAA